MNSLKIYRILTYILLPFGGILALNAINGLIGSLASPGLLIVAFLMACVPLYIFTSSYFFFNGVQKAKPCKASLKEWIKANAIISIIFAAIMFLSSLMALAVINKPEFIAEAIKQLPPDQSKLFGEITPQKIILIFKIFVGIMLPFSLLLIIHIISTFRILKQYNHVFDKA